MIIAVTIDKNTNKVFQHFGESQNFYLYDTEKNEGKIVDNGGNSHHELVPYLKTLGVEVVICGGLGNHAVQLMESKGIKVYPGASGDVNDVIQKYKDNKLIANFSAIHQCSHSH